jgi:hypothetical protein
VRFELEIFSQLSCKVLLYEFELETQTIDLQSNAGLQYFEIFFTCATFEDFSVTYLALVIYFLSFLICSIVLNQGWGSKVMVINDSYQLMNEDGNVWLPILAWLPLKNAVNLMSEKLYRGRR